MRRLLLLIAVVPAGCARVEVPGDLAPVVAPVVATYPLRTDPLPVGVLGPPPAKWCSAGFPPLRALALA